MTTAAPANSNFEPAASVARSAKAEVAPANIPAIASNAQVVASQRLSAAQRVEWVRPHMEAVDTGNKDTVSPSTVVGPGGLIANKPAKEPHNTDRETQVSRLQGRITNVKEQALALRAQSVTLVKHPRFQTIALGGGSGLVIMGPTCAFVGGGAGFVVGTIVGCIPALLTFGISIPVGGLIGGGAGTFMGLALGGGGGLVVGGAAGHVGHAYRAEIKDGFLHIKTKSGERTIDLQVFLAKLVESTKAMAVEMTNLTRTKAVAAHERAKGHVFHMGKTTHGVVTHPKFQVTAASAAGGAVVGGAGGGAAGLVTGGAIGAAVGVIPALFTFGLSIPLFAAIGGGSGLCVGAAAGSTTGAVGCGTTGYHVHTYRNEIKTSANGVWTRASTYAGSVKTKVVGRVGGSK